MKIVIKELGEDIYPEEDALAEMVCQAHAQGWQVAIHAVEERAVAAAAAPWRERWLSSHGRIIAIVSSTAVSARRRWWSE